MNILTTLAVLDYIGDRDSSIFYKGCEMFLENTREGSVGVL